MMDTSKTVEEVKAVTEDLPPELEEVDIEDLRAEQAEDALMQKVMEETKALKQKEWFDKLTK